MNKNYGFSKEQRSTFPYYMAHVFAFNMVALNLHVWKFKYLFHDWYKPWLMLIWKDYKKVQTFHREHSNHHLECRKVHEWDDWAKKIDWTAMAIDWECSRFTKQASPLTAREEAMSKINNNHFYTRAIEEYLLPTLDKLGL